MSERDEVAELRGLLDRLDAKLKGPRKVLDNSRELFRRAVPRFSTLCAEYRLHAEQHLKASTWKIRVFQLTNLIEFFGQKHADAISVPMVDAYKAHRRNTVATRGPQAKEKGFVEPSTVNSELRVLRTIFNWAKVAASERLTGSQHWIDPRTRVLFVSQEAFAKLLDRFPAEALRG